MLFIGVEVEQETSVPPPKKNPGSAPVPSLLKGDFAFPETSARLFQFAHFV